MDKHSEKVLEHLKSKYTVMENRHTLRIRTGSRNIPDPDRTSILIDRESLADLPEPPFSLSITYGGYYWAQLHKQNRSYGLGRLLIRVPADNWLDHINRDSLDNRRSNLRLADPASNGWNRGMSSRNRSGYKGVHQVKGKRKYQWRSEICYKYHRCFLGTFKTRGEAADTYDRAARFLFGEFAAPNSALREHGIVGVDREITRGVRDMIERVKTALGPGRHLARKRTAELKNTGTLECLKKNR